MNPAFAVLAICQWLYFRTKRSLEELNKINSSEFDYLRSRIADAEDHQIEHCVQLRYLRRAEGHTLLCIVLILAALVMIVLTTEPKKKIST